jgi:hypothetical protein
MAQCGNPGRGPRTEWSDFGIAECDTKGDFAKCNANEKCEVAFYYTDQWLPYCACVKDKPTKPVKPGDLQAAMEALQKDIGKVKILTKEDLDKGFKPDGYGTDCNKLVVGDVGTVDIDGTGKKHPKFHVWCDPTAKCSGKKCVVFYHIDPKQKTNLEVGCLCKK